MKRLENVLVLFALAAALPGGRVVASEVSWGKYTESEAVEDQMNFDDGLRYTQLRQSLRIPKAYGRFIAMTPFGGNKVQFWFEADDGSIRNVLVNSDVPLLLQRQGDAARKE